MPCSAGWSAPPSPRSCPNSASPPRSHRRQHRGGAAPGHRRGQHRAAVHPAPDAAHGHPVNLAPGRMTCQQVHGLPGQRPCRRPAGAARSCCPPGQASTRTRPAGDWQRALNDIAAATQPGGERRPCPPSRRSGPAAMQASPGDECAIGSRFAIVTRPHQPVRLAAEARGLPAAVKGKRHRPLRPNSLFRTVPWRLSPRAVPSGCGLPPKEDQAGSGPLDPEDAARLGGIVRL